MTLENIVKANIELMTSTESKKGTLGIALAHATMRKQGRAIVAPVCFVYDKNSGAIYSFCKQGSHDVDREIAEYGASAAQGRAEYIRSPPPAHFRDLDVDGSTSDAALDAIKATFDVYHQMMENTRDN